MGLHLAVLRVGIRRLRSGEWHLGVSYSRLLASTASITNDRLLTVLRMGELEPWIDENFVRNLWFQMGEQVNVKMIRDKFSG
jgi:hypothetical protein